MGLILVVWFPIGKEKDKYAYITRTLKSTSKWYRITATDGHSYTEDRLPSDLPPGYIVEERVCNHYATRDHFDEMTAHLSLHDPKKRGDLFDHWFDIERCSVAKHVRIHGILYASYVCTYARFRMGDINYTLNKIQNSGRWNTFRYRLYHAFSDDITYWYTADEFPYDAYNYNSYEGTVLHTIKTRRGGIRCNLQKDNGHWYKSRSEVYHDVHANTDITVSVPPVKFHDKLKHVLGHKGWVQRHRGWKYITKNKKQWIHNFLNTTRWNYVQTTETSECRDT